MTSGSWRDSGVVKGVLSRWEFAGCRPTWWEAYKSSVSARDAASNRFWTGADLGGCVGSGLHMGKRSTRNPRVVGWCKSSWFFPGLGKFGPGTAPPEDLHNGCFPLPPSTHSTSKTASP